MNKTTAQLTALNAVEINDGHLFTALTALNQRQTDSEIATKQTTEKNSQGFYPRDAAFLTGVALTVSVGGAITDADKAEARRRVLKYRRQVTEILVPVLGIEIEKPKRGRPGRKTEQVAEVTPAPVVPLNNAFADLLS